MNARSPALVGVPRWRKWTYPTCGHDALAGGTFGHPQALRHGRASWSSGSRCRQMSRPSCAALELMKDLGPTRSCSLATGEGTAPLRVVQGVGRGTREGLPAAPPLPRPLALGPHALRGHRRHPGRGVGPGGHASPVAAMRYQHATHDRATSSPSLDQVIGKPRPSPGKAAVDFGAVCR